MILFMSGETKMTIKTDFNTPEPGTIDDVTFDNFVEEASNIPGITL